MTSIDGLSSGLDTSAIINQSNERNASIIDANGRLAIPARITGAVPDLSYQPDQEYIAKALGRAAVREGLDAIFGSEGEGQGAAAGADGGAAEAQDGRGGDPTRQLIERGLEGLLGR